MRRPTVITGPAPLLLLVMLVSLLAATHAAGACEHLPATSVCASLFGNQTRVEVSPQFACAEDAEASLKAAPVVWSAVRLAMGGQRTCQAQLAQLMCMAAYRPCANESATEGSPIDRAFCQTALGAGGSCPPSLQQSLLPLLIPNFGATFNCTSSPLFADAPEGLGPRVPQDPLPSVAEPQCQPLARTSICRGVVDYDVYIPWQHRGSQQLLEAAVKKSYPAFLLADTRTGCQTSLQKMSCGMVYTRCDTTVLAASVPGAPALPIPFPALPCNHLCQAVHEQCEALLAAQPSLALVANCTGVGSILTPTPTCGGKFRDDAAPNFPANYTTLAQVNIGGRLVPIRSQCNSFSSFYPTNASAVLHCPSPLVAASGPLDHTAVLGGACSPPCPSLLFTSEEIAKSDKYFSALSVASFVASSMLFLTWAIFPSKRKQTNTLCFAICTTMISFAMLVAIGETDGRPSRMPCKNRSEMIVQEDGGTCVFQGIFLFYFTLAAVIFWFISATDLYLKIVLNVKIDLIRQKRLNKLYLACGWGVPFILLIGALGDGAFGGNAGTPWCFFSAKNRGYLDWLLFYYPFLILVVAGSFCMCSIIYKMLRSAHITGGTRRAGWWKAQVRPFVFVLLFIWVFVSIFAYRAYMWDNTPHFRSAIVSFVSCVLANNGSTQACGDKPQQTPNLGIWFLVQLAIAGQGLFATLIFGTQWQNVLLWWGLLSGKGANFAGTVESRGTIETGGTGTGSRSGKSGENGSRPGSAHHLARTASGRLDTNTKSGGGGAGAGSYQNGGAVAPLSGATVARISAHVPPVLGASVSGLVASPSGVHVGFADRESFGGGAPASPRGLAAPPANPHLSDNPVLAGLSSGNSGGGNGTMTAEQRRAAEHECVVARDNIPSDEDRI